jgi:type VI protein secretion system component VasF
VLLLAAAGLVVGLWWPLAGIAAAIGLVIYFVLAVGFHVRANDTAHVLTPSVLAGVSAAVVALQLAAP